MLSWSWAVLELFFFFLNLNRSIFNKNTLKWWVWYTRNASWVISNMAASTFFMLANTSILKEYEIIKLIYNRKTSRLESAFFFIQNLIFYFDDLHLQIIASISPKASLENSSAQWAIFLFNWYMNLIFIYFTKGRRCSYWRGMLVRRNMVDLQWPAVQLATIMWQKSDVWCVYSCFARGGPSPNANNTLNRPRMDLGGSGVRHTQPANRNNALPHTHVGNSVQAAGQHNSYMDSQPDTPNTGMALFIRTQVWHCPQPNVDQFIFSWGSLRRPVHMARHPNKYRNQGQIVGQRCYIQGWKIMG